MNKETWKISHDAYWKARELLAVLHKSGEVEQIANLLPLMAHNEFQGVHQLDGTVDVIFL